MPVAMRQDASAEEPSSNGLNAGTSAKTADLAPEPHSKATSFTATTATSVTGTTSTAMPAEG